MADENFSKLKSRSRTAYAEPGDCRALMFSKVSEWWNGDRRPDRYEHGRRHLPKFYA